MSNQSYYFVRINSINTCFSDSNYQCNPRNTNNLIIIKFTLSNDNYIIDKNSTLGSNPFGENYVNTSSNMVFGFNNMGYNKLVKQKYNIWKTEHLIINLYEFFTSCVYDQDFIDYIQDDSVKTIILNLKNKMPVLSSSTYYRGMKLYDNTINKQIRKILSEKDLEVLFNYFNNKENYLSPEVYEYNNNNSFKLTDTLEEEEIYKKSIQYYWYKNEYITSDNVRYENSIRISNTYSMLITNHDITSDKEKAFMNILFTTKHKDLYKTQLQNYKFLFIKSINTLEKKRIKKLFYNNGNPDIFKYIIKIKTTPVYNNIINLSIELYIEKSYLSEILYGKINISNYMLDILFNYSYPKDENTLMKNDIIANSYNKKSEETNGLINNLNYNSNNDVNIDKIQPILNSYYNNSIKLFTHQRDNIIWMYSIEKMIRESKYNYDFIINPNFNIIDTQKYEQKKKFVFLNQKSIINDEDDSLLINHIYNYNDIIKKFTINAQLTGGILADSVGLGKTMSCISHIITSDLIYKTNNSLPYQANNLIIVPNRIVEQWYLEIENYLKPEQFKKIGVKKIMTLCNIKKIKESDLKKTNIFIVNSSIFEFKANYKKFLEQKPNEPQDKFKFDIFKTKWNRIIVDEIHELCRNNIEIKNSISNVINEYKYNNYKILNDGLNSLQIKPLSSSTGIINISKNINDLISNFRWGISGTPFKDPIINLNNMISFLVESKYKKFSKYMIHNFNENKQNKLLDTFIKNHIRSNTKHNLNIKNEIHIPIFTEENTFLTQTNIERNIYLKYINRDSMTLFKLCTHILVSDELLDIENDKILSLQDINKLMNSGLNKEIDLINKEIKTNDNIIKNIQEEIKEQKDISEILNNIYGFINESSIYYINNDNYKSLYSIINRITSLKHNSKLSYHGFIPLFSMLQKQYSTMDKSIDNQILETNIKDIIGTIINEPELYSIRNMNDKYVIMYLYFKRAIKLNNINIENIEKNIELLNKNICVYKKQIDKFNVEYIKESVNDPCVICYSEYEDTPIVITKCKHIFCKVCIDHLFLNKQSISCPYCRTVLTKKDINMTTLELIENPEGNKPKQEQEEDQSSLDKNSYANYKHEHFNHNLNHDKRINLYGTKLTYLLEYIGSIFKNNTTNRIIIFSQYDKLLKMTGKVLEELAFKHIYLKGNVNVISKNIAKFKRDDSYRIIMLSSEYSSSGNNLTEASHIVFLDVLNASQSSTKDIESQAIGRAVRMGQKKHVVIKRFIMKNTIEEETYNKNKYDIKEELMI